MMCGDRKELKAFLCLSMVFFFFFDINMWILYSWKSKVHAKETEVKVLIFKAKTFPRFKEIIL